MGSKTSGQDFVRTLSFLSSLAWSVKDQDFSRTDLCLPEEKVCYLQPLLPSWVSADFKTLAGDSHCLCCNLSSSKNINRVQCYVQPRYITELCSHIFQMLYRHAFCFLDYLFHSLHSTLLRKGQSWVVGVAGTLNHLGKSLFSALFLVSVFIDRESERKRMK